MKFVGKLKNLQGKISRSIFKLTQYQKDPFFIIDDLTSDKDDVGFAQYKYNKEYGIHYFTIFLYNKVLLGFIDKHTSTINVYYYDGYDNEFDKPLNECNSVVLPYQVTRGNWYR